MKIRYYLRGLGLGILVTAIFFMVSGKSNQTMSDEMIKARAKELGMTENVVLADMAKQEEEKPSETVEVEIEVTEEDIIPAEATEASTEDVVEETTTESVEESVEESSVELEQMSEEEVSVDEEVSLEETSEASVAEEMASSESVGSNTESVSVMVNRGDGSDTVSRRLQENGLVADAHEYDRYLMANGYDKRIGVGEHVIPAGATWEDIAKILCNMR